MKVENKFVVVVVIAFSIIIGGALGWESYRPHGASASVPSCTAGPGEQCPSVQFATDYQAWKDLQTEIQKLAKSPTAQELTRKNDEWTGMRDRLAQQVPAGYTFDDAKLKFVLNKPGTANVPPTNPAAGSGTVTK